MYDQKIPKPTPTAPGGAEQDRQVTIDEWDDIVADHYKVPKNLFRAMTRQESGGDPNAVSPTGVRGRQQVTQKVARGYGLDRDDPYQQSAAAARYLREQYDALGDIKDDDERWLGGLSRYYGGGNAVDAKTGILSTKSIDGLSNPAEHVERVARIWGDLNRGGRAPAAPAAPATPAPAGRGARPAGPVAPSGPNPFAIPQANPFQVMAEKALRETAPAGSPERRKGRTADRRPTLEELPQSNDPRMMSGWEQSLVGGEYVRGLQEEKRQAQANERARIEEEASRVPSMYGMGEPAMRFGRGLVVDGAKSLVQAPLMANRDPLSAQVREDLARPIEEFGRQYFPIDERNPASMNPLTDGFWTAENLGKVITQNLPQAAGSMLPYMAVGRGAGLAARLAGGAEAAGAALGGASRLGSLASKVGISSVDDLASAAATSGFGSAQGVVSGYEAAKAAGLDEETARKSGLIEGFIGMLEGVGSPGSKGKFIKSALNNIPKEARGEAIQEMFSQLGQGLNAVYLTGYEKNKGLGDVVGESFGAGALGGVLGGAAAVPGAIAGRRAMRSVGSGATPEAGGAAPALPEPPVPIPSIIPAPGSPAEGLTPAQQLTTGSDRLGQLFQRSQARAQAGQPQKAEKLPLDEVLAKLETEADSLATYAVQNEAASPETAKQALSQSLNRYTKAAKALEESDEYQAELLATASGQAQATPLGDRLAQIRESAAQLQQYADAQKKAEAQITKPAAPKAADVRAAREAEKTQARADLFAEASALADESETRIEELSKAGDTAGLQNELRARQRSLKDALKYAPETPEGLRAKARINRNIDEINTRLKEVSRQSRETARPQNLQTQQGALLDQVVNPEGGVPAVEEVVDPGSSFIRLAAEQRPAREEEPNLLTAIRRAGGIRDDGDTSGELRRLGIREAGTSGLVNNRTGSAIDRMREMMVGEGLSQAETVAEFYDEIEAEMRADQGRRGRQDLTEEEYYASQPFPEEAPEAGESAPTQRPRTVLESVMESPGDVDPEDLEYLRQVMTRSERENPRAYAERTRPGEPGSGGVSLSPFNVLVSNHQPQVERLYNLDLRSDEARAIVDVLRQYSLDHKIELRHLHALLDYVRNYQTDQAADEDQGGPGAPEPGAAPPAMDDRRDTIDRLRDQEYEVNRDLAEEVYALPPEQAEWIRSSGREIDDLLQTLHEDPDMMSLAESAIAGDDAALSDFEHIGSVVYGFDQDTLEYYIENRRAAGRRDQRARSTDRPDRTADSVQAGSARSDQERGLARPDRESEGPQAEPDTDLRSLMTRRRGGSTLSAQDFKLISRPAESIPDNEFDAHLRAVEDLRNRAIIGRVDLTEGEARQVLAVIRTLNEVRTERRKGGVLGPKNEKREGIFEADLTKVDPAKIEQGIKAAEATLALSGVTPGQQTKMQSFLGRARAELAGRRGEEVRTIRHPDPSLDQQPILGERGDGRVIVANPENATGISVVKDRTGEPVEHQSSSTQVNLPKELADKVRAFGKRIPEKNLADNGRESEPHITVKYGLLGSQSAAVREVLEGQGPIRATLGKISLFTTSPDFDVVKIEVESPDLARLHEALKAELPNTETFPEYTPHVTIAYVKKGKGKQFVGDKTFQGQKVEFDRVLFSGREGNREEIPTDEPELRNTNGPIKITNDEPTSATTGVREPGAGARGENRALEPGRSSARRGEVRGELPDVERGLSGSAQPADRPDDRTGGRSGARDRGSVGAPPGDLRAARLPRSKGVGDRESANQGTLGQAGPAGADVSRQASRQGRSEAPGAVRRNQPGRVDRGASELKGAKAQFQPRRRSENRSRAEAARDIRTRGSNSPLRSHVTYGNEQAYDFLRRAIARVDKAKLLEYYGLNYSLAYAWRIRAELRRMAKQIGDPQATAALERFGNDLVERAQDTPNRRGVWIFIDPEHVFSGESNVFRTTRGMVSHELTHDQEALFPSDKKWSAWFERQPQSTAIAKVLEEEGGYEKSELVGETVARIAGKQQEDLGLNLDQARGFLREYFEEIKRRFGLVGLSRFNELNFRPDVRSVLQSARTAPPEGVTANETRTSEDRGTETLQPGGSRDDRGKLRAANRRVSREPRSTAAATPAGDRRRGESLRGRRRGSDDEGYRGAAGSVPSSRLRAFLSDEGGSAKLDLGLGEAAERVTSSKPLPNVPLPEDFNETKWIEGLLSSAKKGEISDRKAKKIASVVEAAMDAVDRNDGAALFRARERVSQISDAKFKLGDLLAAPRTLMGGLDISFFLRQGGFYNLPGIVLRPRETAGIIATGLQAMRESNYDRINAEIAAHPRARQMRESGLFLVNQRKQEGNKLNDREEGYISRFVSDIPIYKHTERGNMTLLDVVRVNAWERYAAYLERAGVTYDENPEAWKQMADWVNKATGRGTFGDYENAVPFLTNVIWSPRWVRSRYQMIKSLVNPRTYRDVNPAVRKLMWRDTGAFMGVLAVTFSLAAAAAAAGLVRIEIGDDPDEADFGKIIINGKFRYDLTSGFGQYIVFASRLMKSAYKKARGQKLEPRENMKSIIERFLRGKSSPALSLGWDLAEGKNFKGDPITAKDAILERVVPIMANDIIESYKNGGGAEGILMATPAILGVGYQVYDRAGQAAASPELAREADRLDVHFGEKRLEGEPEDLRKARLARRAEYLKQYGKELVESPLYRQADDEQKRKMLERLAEGSNKFSNERRPSLGGLSPGAIERALKTGEKRTEKRQKSQERKQIFTPAPR